MNPTSPNFKYELDFLESLSPEEINEVFFPNDFSEEVWRTTYKDHNDQDVYDTWKRIAKDIASVEETDDLKEEWYFRFLDMLLDFKGVPGGRIQSNAGTEWKSTTYFNCFVGPQPETDLDSLESIYKALTYQAHTLKSEGGYGMSFNFLRPRGALIHGVGVESPGAVKFMELWDKSSEIVTSGSGLDRKSAKTKGKIRKGAQMASLNCFEKSTLLLTTEGEVTFEEICKNRPENAYAVTENGNYLIEDFIINPPQQLYLVEDELGNKVEVTIDHKFMVYNVNTKTEYLKELGKIDPETELLVRLS